MLKIAVSEGLDVGSLIGKKWRVVPQNKIEFTEMHSLVIMACGKRGCNQGSVFKYMNDL